ncbi:MAG: rhodanese-like domain-containing protein [Actinomycetota bacterium]|nr:rhodanese-like domain-containing protein [Actinomycetota bacterium]
MTEISEIYVEQLRELDLQSICLVDVREEYEFIEMRVPGAELLPLSEVAESIDLFPTDRPVYLICASGNRSRVAGEFLARHGVAAVNIAGGTKGWVASGLKFNHGDEGISMFAGVE